MRQRVAAVLDYRLQGYSCRVIAKHTGINTSTVHSYLTRALADIAAKTAETAAQVLQMEIERIDRMFAALYSDAAHGDLPSIQQCSKLIELRCRLLGLFPQADRSGHLVNVSIGGTDPRPDAERSGMKITFVNSSCRADEDETNRALAARLITGPVEGNG